MKRLWLTKELFFGENVNICCELVLWFWFCSHYFDKLASPCHILLSPCGVVDEIVWAQTFRSKGSNGIRNSKWNIYWFIKLKFGFQLCWFLSGTFSCLLGFTNFNLYFLQFYKWMLDWSNNLIYILRHYFLLNYVWFFTLMLNIFIST